ncbi:uncharacterized protein LOC112139880 [Oryzias melastigma]|uniref:uncharacterized protein LOC112139880 n=1 Tax=Oryzias melastigma TaxID=30732 RepID=UPI000CF7CD12|nr:uncharacterized protein LOC112139880 [Oryzias melastigma]
MAERKDMNEVAESSQNMRAETKDNDLLDMMIIKMRYIREMIASMTKHHGVLLSEYQNYLEFEQKINKMLTTFDTGPKENKDAMDSVKKDLFKIKTHIGIEMEENKITRQRSQKYIKILHRILAQLKIDVREFAERTGNTIQVSLELQDDCDECVGRSEMILNLKITEKRWESVVISYQQQCKDNVRDAHETTKSFTNELEQKIQNQRLQAKNKILFSKTKRQQKIIASQKKKITLLKSKIALKQRQVNELDQFSRDQEESQVQEEDREPSVGQRSPCAEDAHQQSDQTDPEENPLPSDREEKQTGFFGKAMLGLGVVAGVGAMLYLGRFPNYLATGLFVPM